MRRIGPHAALAFGAVLLGACTDGEFRTLLPDGAVAGYPEVVRLVDERVLDFDAVADDEATGGLGVHFKLRVPGEAIAVGVMLEGKLSGAYRVGEWLDDDQKALASLDDGGLNPEVCYDCLNPTASSDVVNAAMAPNNERVHFAPGTHRLIAIGERFEIDLSKEGVRTLVRTGDPIGGVARMSAYAKIVPKLPETGRVDLNIHFTGAQGWDAASAAQNPALAAVLARVTDIWSQVGLSIGRVSYFDVDPGFEVINDPGTPAPNSDLHSLRRAGTKEPGVNLFFIGTFGFTYGSFHPVGLASGIPGPWRNGTSSSGVTVALDDHVENEVLDTAAVARTVAHEVGHELGLFHTTSLGGVTDPIGDTDDSCTQLMYFATSCATGSDPVGDKLSVEQGKVLRRNMHVYHGDAAEDVNP
ncbi:MAG: hypothetical protein R3A78_09795 [Polyangiales bacterium]